MLIHKVIIDARKGSLERKMVCMFKKVFLLCTVLMFTGFIFADAVFAHPGRTDSNGGHYCRTNCAKWGYKTGEYHYHNSGSSSKSSTTTKSSAPKSTPKPAYTQADIDRGKEAGKSEGYDAGYNRYSKDAKTAAGNEGYKIGYAAGYEAGYQAGLKKIREEDKEAGSSSGKIDGKVAYREGKTKDLEAEASKSDDWNNAYKAAFIQAFEREELIHSAEKAGAELGDSLEEIVVPSKYSADETIKKAFESHYQETYEKRMAEEKKKHLELGQEAGFALKDLDVDPIDSRFADIYKEGYEKGYSEKREEVINDGYYSAFINMKYVESEESAHPEFVAWHKEGFESNKVAVAIKDTAFENGYSSAEYYIPKDFEVHDDAIALYDSLFYEGQDLRKQERQKKWMLISGITLPIGAGIGGLFIRSNRKRKAV